ncbi:hypothetical protein CQ046_23275 [Chryseobacterium sp. MYb7]|nr:hypothetical protein CQ046_23275 [Chryseobacterium sp. MYb7]
MMKTFLTLLLFLIICSCKEAKGNISNPQKTKTENNKSFVISCGSGCAMTYTAENILQNGIASIKVKFKVEMYTD